MTLYQEIMMLKSQVLTCQAAMLIHSAQQEFQRTGNTSARKIERIAELNYKAQVLRQCAGRVPC